MALEETDPLLAFKLQTKQKQCNKKLLLGRSFSANGTQVLGPSGAGGTREERTQGPAVAW